MTDLFSEAEGKIGATKAKAVMATGGDLLDQAGFASGDSEIVRSPEKYDTQPFLDDLNASLSPLESFLVGTGRGLATIGRGVGLVDKEDPLTREAATQLTDDSTSAMIGQAVGESLPFLAAAPATGVGLATSTGGKILIPAAQKLLTRVATGAAVGATEGALIARGLDGDTNQILGGAGIGGTIAGAAEALIPVIGRIGGSLFRKLKRTPKGPLMSATGEPTEELISALNEAGMSFDDLTDQAVDFIADRQGSITNPAEAARQSRFDSLDIPYTKGDISQDFAQQAAEQRLMSMGTGANGEPLRQLKLDQSQGLQARIGELVDNLGVPGRTGESVKDALTGRKKLLTKAKNSLYREVAEQAPELESVPIITDTLLEALPDGKTLRRLNRIAGSQVGAVRDLMVEFGIDQSDEAVEAFIKNGDEITPLSLGNFEDFRSALNQIERADTTGAASVAIGPLRTALDAEAELVDDAVRASGVSDLGILDKLKEARGTVRQVKTEFSPESITGRLIGKKRDGVTPIIEASRVAKEFYSKPVEQLDLTIRSLQKSGQAGKKAIGDMRATVVLNALNDALKAPSRKTSGLETIGGNQFHKSLQKFGDDKLEILFRGDKAGLKQLRALQSAALDISPSAAATPKGSAPVIMDALSRMGRIPLIGETVNLAKLVFNGGADDRAVARALKARPDLKRVTGVLEAEFPVLAAALGVNAAINPKEDKEQ